MTWAVLALVLAQFAHDAGTARSWAATATGVAFSGVGLYDLICSRGRHVGWPLLMGMGIVAQLIARVLTVGVLANYVYGLDSLPEAHCFLRYAEMRVDVTRLGSNPSEQISEFLYEEDISPDQIGEYKTSLHRRFLSQWMREVNTTTRYSLDELWQIREACIAALSAA